MQTPRLRLVTGAAEVASDFDETTPTEVPTVPQILPAVRRAAFGVVAGLVVLLALVLWWWRAS